MCVHPTLEPRRIIALVAIVVSCVAAPATPALAQANLVTVVATDHAFDAPASIRAGVTAIRLINRGKTDHHIVVLRLPAGVSLEEYERSVTRKGARKLPLAAYGGPETPVNANDVASVIVELRPGRYVLTCEYRFPDGTNHASRGMFVMLNVFPASRVALQVLPTADATVAMKDHSFALSTPLVAGPQVLRVDNRGAQEHQMVIGRLLPGRKTSDVLAWLRTGKGERPYVYSGGTTRQSPGRTS